MTKKKTEKKKIYRSEILRSMLICSNCRKEKEEEEVCCCRNNQFEQAIDISDFGQEPVIYLLKDIEIEEDCDEPPEISYDDALAGHLKNKYYWEDKYGK